MVSEHEGDGDDDDTKVVDPEEILRAAEQRVRALQLELIELQKKYLARGTRDVLEQAREAVERTMRELVDDIEN